MSYIALIIPRPVRDLYSQYKVLGKLDTDNITYAANEKQFMAITAERLLLSCLGAAALRYLPAPKWATYGVTAILSLPAAVALGAGELAYRGLSSVSRLPSQLALSATLLGLSLVLFENYDRFDPNGLNGGKLHLRPETLEQRYTTWSNQKRIHNSKYGFNTVDLLEPKLMSVNQKYFSGRR